MLIKVFCTYGFLNKAFIKLFKVLQMFSSIFIEIIVCITNRFWLAFDEILYSQINIFNQLNSNQILAAGFLHFLIISAFMILAYINLVNERIRIQAGIFLETNWP